MDEKEVSQVELALDVSSKIKYNPIDHFIVKPLDPVKVTKEFSKPVSKGEPTKDAEGIEAQDFDTVETEVKEVDSDYRRGIVLKLPEYYNHPSQEGTYRTEVKIGDVVIFRETAGLRFDLLKDSRLIRLFDIIAIESNDSNN